MNKSKQICSKILFVCCLFKGRIAPLPDELNPYVQIFKFLVKVGKAKAAFTVTKIQKLCRKFIIGANENLIETS